VLGRLAVHARHPGVPGGERPEHGHRLRAAALADEDAVGVHSQGVGDDVLERDGRKPVVARGARFVADAVGEDGRQLELGRGLADDDPLGAGNRPAERVQERRLAGRDSPGDDDVLPGADAGSEEGGGLLAREAEPDELVERAGGEPEAADGADRVPVRGDGRDRGGEARAVGEARLDTRGDAVEPLALDLFEQPLDEGADLAVVVEHEVGNALDPLTGVSEEAFGAVDHPLLRDRVGQHPLGDRPQPDELVSQLVGNRRALLGGERRRLTTERLRLVGAERLLDQRLGAGSTVLARQVDLLGREGVLEAETDRLAGFYGQLRHAATSSWISARCWGGVRRNFRSRGAGTNGRKSSSSSLASARAYVPRGRARESGSPARCARASARPSPGSQASSANRRSASWR
jgi:hypothetical protein